MAEVEVKGLSELLANMKKFPGIIQQKCLRRAMVPGAQKIRNAAKEIERSKTGFWSTGLLESAIRIAYNKKESTPGKAVYHVFVSMAVKRIGDVITQNYRQLKKVRSTGLKGKSKDAFYWRFLEFGTSKMPAKPFMRPAFDSNVGAVIDLIKNKLAELIEKEASSLGR